MVTEAGGVIMDISGASQNFSKYESLDGLIKKSGIIAVGDYLENKTRRKDRCSFTANTLLMVMNYLTSLILVVIGFSPPASAQLHM